MKVTRIANLLLSALLVCAMLSVGVAQAVAGAPPPADYGKQITSYRQIAITEAEYRAYSNGNAKPISKFVERNYNGWRLKQVFKVAAANGSAKIYYYAIIFRFTNVAVPILIMPAVPLPKVSECNPTWGNNCQG